jgi:thiol-disulfide isomerase/thioredoxin
MKSIFGLFFSLILWVGVGVSKLQAQSSKTRIQSIGIRQLDSLLQARQAPLIINFWATFCKPCIEEIPFLEASVRQYEKMGLELWLVSLDMEEMFPSKLEVFTQKRSFQSRQFWLQETNADVFCPIIDPQWSGAIPASLFIHRATGYRKFYEEPLNEQQIKSAVQLLLQ